MRSLSLFPAKPPDQNRGGHVLALLSDGKQVRTIGFAVYLLSFMLPAVGGPGRTGSRKGYFCAEFALLYPWRTEGRKFLRDSSFAVVSLPISGWINLLFLAAMIFLLRRPSSSNGPALRILTLCAIPFCWIVFAYDGSYPREGHVLWVAGMVATLASDGLAKLAGRLASANEPERVD